MNLPPVGLGTMGVTDSTVLSTAIETGYRHPDTAQIYDNEAVVGAGIDGADRRRLTVATKLWTDSDSTPSTRCTSTARVRTATRKRRSQRSKRCARRG